MACQPNRQGSDSAEARIFFFLAVEAQPLEEHQLVIAQEREHDASSFLGNAESVERGIGQAPSMQVLAYRAGRLGLLDGGGALGTLEAALGLGGANAVAIILHAQVLLRLLYGLGQRDAVDRHEQVDQVATFASRKVFPAPGIFATKLYAQALPGIAQDITGLPFARGFLAIGQQGAGHALGIVGEHPAQFGGSHDAPPFAGVGM